MALFALMTIHPASLRAKAPPQELTIYAAGSLRNALSDLAVAFEQEHTVRPSLTFGASGLLKDRITAGESPQVFASANMSHPEMLAASGKTQSVSAFARNSLCVLATPAFSLQGKPLAQRLLDAEVRVGTSTPRADPSGDYAFSMFDRIESTGAAGAGAAAALKSKAQQLTGGPNSPKPPAGRSVYGDIVSAGAVDVFISYCTNATQARNEHAELQIVAVPEAINVSARYGVALMQGAGEPAQAFVRFMLGQKGQAILARHGFSPP